MDKELRYLQIQNMEVRNKSDTNEKIVVGYVVKFNERSQLIYNEFYEKVSKGAFAKSIEQNTIKALWDHNTNLVLGSTRAGTLKIEEDDIGLKFEIILPNTETGRNAFESIQRGDVDGVSFGFYVRNDNWEYLKDEDIYERTLLDIDLYEISPTPFPAYETSEVAKRTIKNLKKDNNKEADMIDIKLKLLEL